MKVLVVDDDAIMRLLVEKTVRQFGHDVTVADSGAEAWTHLQNKPADLVLSDWVMADVDGLELCRRIRADLSREYTYVILLTSLSARTHYLAAIEAGVDDFLTKPFDSELLAARLRVAERILGLRHHVQRLETLLPICMYCKKIRDAKESWVGVETYLKQQTARELTHGICPHCYENVARPAIARAREELRRDAERRG